MGAYRGVAAVLALAAVASLASASQPTDKAPVAHKKGTEVHHLHLAERMGSMRFAEVGAELKVDAEAERRRRTHRRAHARSKTAVKTDARGAAGLNLNGGGRSQRGYKSSYNAKTGSSTVKSGGGAKGGMGLSVGIMGGGMGMGMMGGGMGMMGGMGGMGMGGMMAHQPVDFPPRGVGMAPMGFGQFVPAGKAIPRQPGVMYYTASGVQECAVCKQIVHTAARWGTGFYGLCQMDKEQLDMCHAQQKVLQACPEFTNNWCYQDMGGTQVLRSPCPVHLICHYCLGSNPLHCATREVIDTSLDSIQKT